MFIQVLSLIFGNLILLNQEFLDIKLEFFPFHCHLVYCWHFSFRGGSASREGIVDVVAGSGCLGRLLGVGFTLHSLSV